MKKNRFLTSLPVLALSLLLGLACNVTSDGALTLIISAYADRHGIAADDTV